MMILIKVEAVIAGILWYLSLGVRLIRR